MNKIRGNVADIIIVITSIIYSFYLGISTRKILAGILSAVGIYIWLNARITLGQAFSITPQARFLVKNGVYKKIRHPIYLASTIAIAGVCIMYNLWWMYILLIAVIILQFIRSHLEEKVLLKKFSDEYLEYKKSTWF